MLQVQDEKPLLAYAWWWYQGRWTLWDCSGARAHMGARDDIVRVKPGDCEAKLIPYVMAYNRDPIRIRSALPSAFSQWSNLGVTALGSLLIYLEPIQRGQSWPCLQSSLTMPTSEADSETMFPNLLEQISTQVAKTNDKLLIIISALPGWSLLPQSPQGWGYPPW